MAAKPNRNGYGEILLKGDSRTFLLIILNICLLIVLILFFIECVCVGCASDSGVRRSVCRAERFVFALIQFFGLCVCLKLCTRFLSGLRLYRVPLPDHWQRHRQRRRLPDPPQPPNRVRNNAFRPDDELGLWLVRQAFSGCSILFNVLLQLLGLFAVISRRMLYHMHSCISLPNAMCFWVGLEAMDLLAWWSFFKTCMTWRTGSFLFGLAFLWRDVSKIDWACFTFTHVVRVFMARQASIREARNGAGWYALDLSLAVQGWCHPQFIAGLVDACFVRVGLVSKGECFNIMIRVQTLLAWLYGAVPPAWAQKQHRCQRNILPIILQALSGLIASGTCFSSRQFALISVHAVAACLLHWLAGEALWHVPGLATHAPSIDGDVEWRFRDFIATLLSRYANGRVTVSRTESCTLTCRRSFMLDVLDGVAQAPLAILTWPFDGPKAPQLGAAYQLTRLVLDAPVLSGPRYVWTRLVRVCCVAFAVWQISEAAAIGELASMVASFVDISPSAMTFILGADELPGQSLLPSQLQGFITIASMISRHSAPLVHAVVGTAMAGGVRHANWRTRVTLVFVTCLVVLAGLSSLETLFYLWSLYAFSLKRVGRVSRSRFDVSATLKSVTLMAPVSVIAGTLAAHSFPFSRMLVRQKFLLPDTVCVLRISWGFLAVPLVRIVLGCTAVRGVMASFSLMTVCLTIVLQYHIVGVPGWWWTATASLRGCLGCCVQFVLEKLKMLLIFCVPASWGLRLFGARLDADNLQQDLGPGDDPAADEDWLIPPECSDDYTPPIISGLVRLMVLCSTMWAVIMVVPFVGLCLAFLECDGWHFVCIEHDPGACRPVPTAGEHHLLGKYGARDLANNFTGYHSDHGVYRDYEPAMCWMTKPWVRRLDRVYELKHDIDSQAQQLRRQITCVQRAIDNALGRNVQALLLERHRLQRRVTRCMQQYILLCRQLPDCEPGHVPCTLPAYVSVLPDTHPTLRHVRSTSESRSVCQNRSVLPRPRVRVDKLAQQEVRHVQFAILAEGVDFVRVVALTIVAIKRASVVYWDWLDLLATFSQLCGVAPTFGHVSLVAGFAWAWIVPPTLLGHIVGTEFVLAHAVYKIFSYCTNYPRFATTATTMYVNLILSPFSTLPVASAAVIVGGLVTESVLSIPIPNVVLRATMRPVRMSQDQQRVMVAFGATIAAIAMRRSLPLLFNVPLAFALSAFLLRIDFIFYSDSAPAPTCHSVVQWLNDLRIHVGRRSGMKQFEMQRQAQAFLDARPLELSREEAVKFLTAVVPNFKPSSVSGQNPPHKVNNETLRRVARNQGLQVASVPVVYTPGEITTRVGGQDDIRIPNLSVGMDGLIECVKRPAVFHNNRFDATVGRSGSFKRLERLRINEGVARPSGWYQALPYADVGERFHYVVQRGSRAEMLIKAKTTSSPPWGSRIHTIKESNQPMTMAEYAHLHHLYQGEFRCICSSCAKVAAYEPQQQSRWCGDCLTEMRPVQYSDELVARWQSRSVMPTECFKPLHPVRGGTGVGVLVNGQEAVSILTGLECDMEVKLVAGDPKLVVGRPISLGLPKPQVVPVDPMLSRYWASLSAFLQHLLNFLIEVLGLEHTFFHRACRRTRSAFVALAYQPRAALNWLLGVAPAPPLDLEPPHPSPVIALHERYSDFNRTYNKEVWWAKKATSTYGSVPKVIIIPPEGTAVIHPDSDLLTSHNHMIAGPTTHALNTKEAMKEHVTRVQRAEAMNRKGSIVFRPKDQKQYQELFDFVITRPVQVAIIGRSDAEATKAANASPINQRSVDHDVPQAGVVSTSISNQDNYYAYDPKPNVNVKYFPDEQAFVSAAMDPAFRVNPGQGAPHKITESRLHDAPVNWEDILPWWKARRGADIIISDCTQASMDWLRGLYPSATIWTNRGKLHCRFASTVTSNVDLASKNKQIERFAELARVRREWIEGDEQPGMITWQRTIASDLTDQELETHRCVVGSVSISDDAAADGIPADASAREASVATLVRDTLSAPYRFSSAARKQASMVAYGTYWVGRSALEHLDLAMSEVSAQIKQGLSLHLRPETPCYDLTPPRVLASDAPLSQREVYFATHHNAGDLAGARWRTALSTTAHTLRRRVNDSIYTNEWVSRSAAHFQAQGVAQMVDAMQFGQEANVEASLARYRQQDQAQANAVSDAEVEAIATQVFNAYKVVLDNVQPVHPLIAWQRMPKKLSSGNGLHGNFCLGRPVTKRRDLQAVHMHRPICEQVLKDVERGLYRRSAYHVIVKKYPLKLATLLERPDKIRTVVAADLRTYLQDAVWEYDADKAFVHFWDQVPAKLGMPSNAAGFNEALKQLGEHDAYFSMDATAFDANIPSIIARVVAKARAKGFRGGISEAEADQVLRAVLDRAANGYTVNVATGSVWQKFRGFATGRCSTSTDNSLALYAVLLFAFMVTTGLPPTDYHKWASLINMGDDNIIGSSHPLFTAEAIASVVKNKLGIEMREEAPPGELHSQTFLKKTFSVMADDRDALADLRKAGIDPLEFRYSVRHDAESIKERRGVALSNQPLAEQYERCLGHLALTCHHRELYDWIAKEAQLMYAELMKHPVAGRTIRPVPSYDMVVRQHYAPLERPDHVHPHVAYQAMPSQHLLRQWLETFSVASAAWYQRTKVFTAVESNVRKVCVNPTSIGARFERHVYIALRLKEPDVQYSTFAAKCAQHPFSILLRPSAFWDAGRQQVHSLCHDELVKEEYYLRQVYALNMAILALVGWQLPALLACPEFFIAYVAVYGLVKICPSAYAVVSAWHHVHTLDAPRNLADLCPRDAFVVEKRLSVFLTDLVLCVPYSHFLGALILALTSLVPTIDVVVAGPRSYWRSLSWYWLDNEETFDPRDSNAVLDLSHDHAWDNAVEDLHKTWVRQEREGLPKIVVVTSPTGGGKSRVLTRLLALGLHASDKIHDVLYANSKRVWLALPRRFQVTEFGVTPGELNAKQSRCVRKLDASVLGVPRHGLMVATAGHLLERWVADPSLCTREEILVVDEAHERVAEMYGLVQLAHDVGMPVVFTTATAHDPIVEDAGWALPLPPAVERDMPRAGGLVMPDVLNYGSPRHAIRSEVRPDLSVTQAVQYALAEGCKRILVICPTVQNSGPSKELSVDYLYEQHVEGEGAWGPAASWRTLHKNTLPSTTDDRHIIASQLVDSGVTLKESYVEIDGEMRLTPIDCVIDLGYSFVSEAIGPVVRPSCWATAMQRRGRTGRQCDGLYLRLVAQFGDAPPALLPASLARRTPEHKALFRRAHPAGRYLDDFVIAQPGRPIVQPLRGIISDVVLEGGKKAAYDCLHKATHSTPDEALELLAQHAGMSLAKFYDEIVAHHADLVAWLRNSPITHSNGTTGDAVILSYRGAEVLSPGRLRVQRPRFHCEAGYGPSWVPANHGKVYWAVQTVAICTSRSRGWLPPFPWLRPCGLSEENRRRYTIRWSSDPEIAKRQVGQCIGLLTRGGTLYDFGRPAAAPTDGWLQCPTDLRSRFYWDGQQLYDSGWSHLDRPS